MRGVLYLGGLYFILSLLITTISNVTSYSPSTASEPYNHLLSLIPLLFVVVDLTYCVRIFSSINSLIKSLSSREEDKQQSLLLISYYRSFRGVLFALLSFVLCMGVVCKLMLINDNYWRDRWTVDALWASRFLSFFLFYCLVIFDAFPWVFRFFNCISPIL